MRIIKAVIVTGILAALVLGSVSTVFAQDEESFIREPVLPKSRAILLSAVFPGLGQMTSGQRVKGVSMFLAETVSLVLAVNSHESYNTKFKVYEKEYDLFTNKSGVVYYDDVRSEYRDLQDKSDELDDLNTIRNAALITAGVVYAYNIFDILFMGPSDDGMRADASSRLRLQSTMIDRTPGLLFTKSF